MKKIYHLSSCSTCQRLLKSVDFEGAGFELQDVKSNNIEADTLDFLKDKIGSYEGLFSKRAMKFRQQGLHEQDLKDEDFRKLILEEYTFLKRPVVIDGDLAFVGNAKKTFEAIINHVGA